MGQILTLNDFSSLIHEMSDQAGWWSDDDKKNPYVVPLKISLIHSEISEALEGHRKDLMDDKLPHRSAIEVELADALIRIFDLAGFLGLDLSGAVDEKIEYNLNREDHKLENRVKQNGKKY